MPGKPSTRTTSSRKQQHVDLALRDEVAFRTKSTGLEAFDFVHNALPELNLSEVDTSVRFLGCALALPFMVSCMTGGYPGALAINRQLAEVCQENGIAMGVGSQRQAMEDDQYHKTFSIVRQVAPTIPIVGNIGAVEVARLKNADPVRRLVDLIGANGFAVHLNPLQEFLQPEGNTDFRGVLRGIAMLVRDIHVPIIVKEIGAGVSRHVARRLLDAGVRHIDIAGAGGTSWAGIETLRGRDHAFSAQFWDWGIPTATSLRTVATLKTGTTPFTLIASGGIASGMDAARCIALGADMVASARPVLQALDQGGRKGVTRLLAQWAKTLRGVMFLTGSRSIAALQQVPLVARGEL